MGAALSAAGVLAIVVAPLVQALDCGGLPRLLQNYLSTRHGSVFTLFPWLGYMLLGGACGTLLHPQGAWPQVAWRTRCLTPAWMLAGLSLHLWAAALVWNAHGMCPTDWDCAVLKPAHVWLDRLGLVLAFLGALMASEGGLRRYAPDWLLHSGRHTLLVFAVHAVVLYGAVTGYGLDRLVHRALPPIGAIAGAGLFIAAHVALVQGRRALRARRWVPEATDVPPPPPVPAAPSP